MGGALPVCEVSEELEKRSCSEKSELQLEKISNVEADPGPYVKLQASILTEFESIESHHSHPACLLRFEPIHDDKARK